MKPYAYKTTDYGKTWTSLNVQENGVVGYAHVIKEDTVDPNLLFLGTEFGLWISVDGGQRWAQYKATNFPSVAVRDLVVHARESDLVLATHGRGIWIIDDISPLRALTPDLMAKDATLFQGPPAIQYFNANGGWAEGDESFNGPSRPTDAFIDYYQKRRHIFGDLKIEILDQNGKLVDTVPGSKHRGLNRATWSMRLKPPIVPPAASALFQAAQGPRVLPGTYTIRMTKGDQVYTEPLKVVLDPRAKYTVEDRKAQFELAMKLDKMLGHMSYAVSAIEGVRDTSAARSAKLAEKDRFAAACSNFRSSWIHFVPRSWPPRKAARLRARSASANISASLYGDVNGYEGRPTDYQIARADSLGHELEDVIADFRKLTDQELSTINADLKKKKLDAIPVLAEADWEKQHEESSAKSGGAELFVRNDD